MLTSMREGPPVLNPYHIPSRKSSSTRHPSEDGRRSPFQSSTRTGISSRPIDSAFSGVSISQDSAFPPFPTSKLRSTTPTAPLTVMQSFAFPRWDDQANTDPQSSYAPLSPRDNGGGSVLQRMDTIAPGPFQLSGYANFRHTGHKRTATMSSSKDFTHESTVGIGKGHFQRPSTAGSMKSSQPSLSTINGGPRSTLNRDASHVPTLPTPPAHLVASQAPDSISANFGPESGRQPIEPLRPEKRSSTYPLDKSDDRQREGSVAFPMRKASEPASHGPKLSISLASAIRPLHEIGSISSFKPSRSVKGRKPAPIEANNDNKLSIRSTSGNEGRQDIGQTDSPTVPVSAQPHIYNIENPYHTPTESVASNESSRSDFGSASSKSTPPRAESPKKPIRKLSDVHHGDNPKTDASVAAKPTITEPSGLRPISPPGYSRPTYSKPPEQAVVGELGKPTLIPAIDPAIQHPSPVTSPDGCFSPFYPLQSGNLLLSPAPLPPQSPAFPARRAKTANKGKCRGCEELIHGKSVSSADGRLTGRYHKHCFVCTTCKAPFRTADFYILDNQPYCQRHYHTLNHSLCTSCDGGIEGQYLETNLKQKFHPNCFVCQVSGREFPVDPTSQGEMEAN